MAFYSYLSTKIIIAFITKSYKDLFGVRSYINAYHCSSCGTIIDRDYNASLNLLSLIIKKQIGADYPKSTPFLQGVIQLDSYCGSCRTDMLEGGCCG